MIHPTTYLQGRGPTVLRQAFGTLIGSGMGCDDAGDDRSPTADAALRNIAKSYAVRVGRAAYARALALIVAARRT